MGRGFSRCPSSRRRAGPSLRQLPQTCPAGDSRIRANKDDLIVLIYCLRRKFLHSQKLGPALRRGDEYRDGVTRKNAVIPCLTRDPSATVAVIPFPWEGVRRSTSGGRGKNAMIALQHRTTTPPTFALLQRGPPTS